MKWFLFTSLLVLGGCSDAKFDFDNSYPDKICIEWKMEEDRVNSGVFIHKKCTQYELKCVVPYIIKRVSYTENLDAARCVMP